MRTINLTYKCQQDKCPYTNEPITCIQPSDEVTPQVCEYLYAYLTPQPTKPALPECIHRQHTCQECQQDHPNDYKWCQSPAKDSRIYTTTKW